MSPEAINATIRVRPLRFGFVIKPNDRAALKRAIEVNTCLWGGIFNFIIPLFRRTPKRYNDHPFRGPNAKQLLDGFVEAFEPDFLVEAEPGLASRISFPGERVIGFDDLFRRDEHGRGGYGLTLFDVCDALYQDTFRFVQRHPQRVVVPQAGDPVDDLLISSFHEKLYNRCSAHSTPVAPAAPLRHRAFLASAPAAGVPLDPR